MNKSREDIEIHNSSDEDDNDDKRTIYCVNLHENVTEEILYELFVQSGPIESVIIPKTSGRQKGYAFITYVHKCSVPYSLKLFEGIKLFEKQIYMNRRQRNPRILNTTVPSLSIPHANGSPTIINSGYPLNLLNTTTTNNLMPMPGPMFAPLPVPTTEQIAHHNITNSVSLDDIHFYQRALLSNYILNLYRTHY